MMSRPPKVGDLIREETVRRLQYADIYRVTYVDNNVVKYVLVSEVTPTQKIRKFYAKSIRSYECDHKDFGNTFSLDVKGIYQAELDVVTNGWAAIIGEL